MGYKLAGFDVIGCCEIDERMMNIYKKNHNPKYAYCMDIREFNKLDNLPEELYDLDILDGSPPCTPFSFSGKREKVWGKKKKFREGQKEQTLDDLSFIFIETINKLKPKVVVMENVEGLIKGKAWEYVRNIYINITNIGYKVKHFLLKGEDMGIPQKRHRVFFIAIRNDINFDINKLNLEFNYRHIPFKEVRSKEGKKMVDGRIKYLLSNSIDSDKSISDIVFRLEGKKSFFSTYIIKDEEVSNTITTGYATLFRKVDKKMFSDIDYTYCSTFPQDYDFLDQKVYYVCGMSVPPVMIKRIAQRLLDSNIFYK